MSDNTKIEWADATVNAINGCSVVSPGCTNCYAMRLAGTRLKHHPTRKGLTTDSKAGPVWNGQVRLHEPALMQPLAWKRPRRIFWNAHGDLFHPAVPDEWIDRVFAVCALTQQHTHMILTKRSARMREYMGNAVGRVGDKIIQMRRERGDYGPIVPVPSIPLGMPWWPLPNVWLGVSVEDQARADERILDLLATPAAVRFVSCEPLFGPVDLEVAWHGENAIDSECWGDCAWCNNGHPPLHNCQAGRQSSIELERGRSGIDWVIVGGESGPGARPMHPAWARSLRDQCAAAGVPFYFKQFGEHIAHPAPSAKWSDGSAVDPDLEPVTFERVGKKLAGRLLDGVEHNGMPAVPHG